MAQEGRRKMKILTRKQQDEILKLLAANRVIMHHSTIELDHYTTLLENSSEIANLVGGVQGMVKVQNTVTNCLGGKDGEHHD